MKILLSVMISLLFVSGMFAQTSSEEKEVRQAIQLYFDGFNSHDVGRVAEFTTATGTTSIQAAGEGAGAMMCSRS